MKQYAKALLGGAIGVLIGGFVYFLAAYLTGWIVGIVASVSGTIAGFFVGMMGRDLKRKEHLALMGAAFGLIAILTGYFMMYLAPIELIPGYSVSASELMSFPEFMALDFGAFDLLFIALGIYGGYRAAEWKAGTKKDD